MRRKKKERCKYQSPTRGLSREFVWFVGHWSCKVGIESPQRRVFGEEPSEKAKWIQSGLELVRGWTRTICEARSESTSSGIPQNFWDQVRYAGPSTAGKPPPYVWWFETGAWFCFTRFVFRWSLSNGWTPAMMRNARNRVKFDGLVFWGGGVCEPFISPIGSRPERRYTSYKLTLPQLFHVSAVHTVIPLCLCWSYAADFKLQLYTRISKIGSWPIRGGAMVSPL